MEDIIINGRAQVIELLKKLPNDNKEKILASVKQKNPKLAKELSMHTITFESFLELEDIKIAIALPYISNRILALALKSLNHERQGKILKSLNKTRAIEVFGIIRSDTASLQDSMKARDKIAQILSSLYQSELL